VCASIFRGDTRTVKTSRICWSSLRSALARVANVGYNPAMPTLSDPFIKSELLGVFIWEDQFTADLKDIDKWMYTACHEETLRKNILCGKLRTRASFNVQVGSSLFNTRCSWLTPQDWHRRVGHNHFGPFIVQIKMRELEGKRFYVYTRKPDGKDRRYYFVQREDTTPLFRSRPAKFFDPRECFNNSRQLLSELRSVQYEIVLTESLSLAKARVVATSHQKCYAGKEHCYKRFIGWDAVNVLEKILGCELDDSEVRRFPDPYPLRKVIPAHRLPLEMQPA
jgi:hypothetical protein